MIAVDRRFLKRLQYHRLHGGRHLGVRFAQRPGLGLNMLQCDGYRRFPVKGNAAGQHLIEHYTHTVKVA